MKNIGWNMHENDENDETCMKITKNIGWNMYENDENDETCMTIMKNIGWHIYENKMMKHVWKWWKL